MAKKHRITITTTGLDDAQTAELQVNIIRITQMLVGTLADGESLNKPGKHMWDYEATVSREDLDLARAAQDAEWEAK
jgi:hypothetical protein